MKNVRKAKQRIAEHDRLFSKGWLNYKASTSTFLTNCQPRFVKSEKEAAQKPKHVVYLVRARCKSAGIPYSFLKVGISGFSSIRFDFDSHRYSFATLSLINCASRDEARKIEAGVLRKFKDKKHVPRIRLLSGGNTECLIDELSVENQLKAEFVSLGAVDRKIEPEVNVGPQIHNLLLMLDCKDYCDSALEERLRNFRGNLKSLGARVPSYRDLFVHYTRKIRKKPP